MDAPDSSPGTVYFALSITLLFLVFWRTNSPDDKGYIAAAGTMAMTWGDSMAAIIGKRFGRHRYHVAGGTRSWEGSAAMFVAAAISMFLTLVLVPGSALGPLTLPLATGVALAAALTGALVAAVAEAFSPAGMDNLSVPLLAGAVVFGIATLVG
jgi:dolichol kinase